MINCPKCAHDNQLGAIFCRGCGAKLDIETIRPEVKDSSASMRWFAWLRSLLMFVVFISLVGIIAALFVPAGFPVAPVLDEKSQPLTKEKFDKWILRAEHGTGENAFIFAPAEIAWYYNSTVLDSVKAPGSTYAIESIELSQAADEVTVIVMNTKLFGFLPARFEMNSKLVNGEKSSLEQIAPSLEIRTVKMGHIKMPDALKLLIASKFAPLLQGKNIDGLLKSVAAITVDANGNYVFALFKAPPAKK